MNGNVFLWILVGLAVVGLALVLTRYRSSDARLAKRRRKSHSKIVSKAGRPIVKFSVRPPEEK